MPCRYGGADDRRRLRPAHRVEDPLGSDRRPTTPAYIQPACTTNAENLVLVHPTKATALSNDMTDGRISTTTEQVGGVGYHVFGVSHTPAERVGLLLEVGRSIVSLSLERVCVCPESKPR